MLIELGSEIWGNHPETPRPRLLTRSQVSRSRSPWVTTGCSSHQVMSSLVPMCKCRSQVWNLRYRRLLPPTTITRGSRRVGPPRVEPRRVGEEAVGRVCRAFRSARDVSMTGMRMWSFALSFNSAASLETRLLLSQSRRRNAYVPIRANHLSRCREHIRSCKGEHGGISKVDTRIQHGHSEMSGQHTIHAQLQEIHSPQNDPA